MAEAVSGVRSTSRGEDLGLQPRPGIMWVESGTGYALKALVDHRWESTTYAVRPWGCGSWEGAPSWWHGTRDGCPLKSTVRRARGGTFLRVRRWRSLDAARREVLRLYLYEQERQARSYRRAMGINGDAP